jgi:hypothetical protein
MTTTEAPTSEASALADPADRSSTDVAFAQWLLASLLVSAGAIHVAMAPSHFGESPIEGVGFLVAAWLQIGLGVAVVLRPSRGVISAVIAVSSACIAAWVVSRTAGLPFGEHSGHAESLTIVDGVTVAMEATSILIAVTLLSQAMVRFRSTGLALAASIGVFALTSAVIASPAAREHAAAAHGDHGEEATHSHADTTSDSSGRDGHDHATLATDASSGALTDLNGHKIEGVKAQDVAHEMEPDKPLDPTTRRELAQQLIAARETALQYPTVADAERAGYRLVGGGFGPGSGAHYISFGSVFGTFDAAKPPTLIYSGIDPTSQIVGLMYLGNGANNAAPEGFAGPNDHWHRHSGVCLKGADVILPVDASVTEAQCTEAGGGFMETTTWMVHAWVVPGWDSPWGVFSHENPNLRCADGTFNTDELGRCQGS